MTALILVDLQNDFLPGGALAVPGGDAVIGPANALAADRERFGLVVATQDWHPPVHRSFAANHDGKRVGETVDLHGLPQVLWPTHCVAGTRGARLADALDQTRVEAIFRKGTDPTIDSYSGLYDNGHRRATGLAAYLRGRGVTRVAVCGLATDYCVKFTALDALRDGFDVELIEFACRGVNLTPGDADAAIAEMQRSGVTLSCSGRELSSDRNDHRGGDFSRHLRPPPVRHRPYPKREPLCPCSPPSTTAPASPCGTAPAERRSSTAPPAPSPSAAASSP